MQKLINSVALGGVGSPAFRISKFAYQHLVGHLECRFGPLQSLHLQKIAKTQKKYIHQCAE